MTDIEETYPYCRWCGRYMGYPNNADHSQRHTGDCRLVIQRRAKGSKKAIDSHLPTTDGDWSGVMGDTTNFDSISSYKSGDYHG